MPRPKITLNGRGARELLRSIEVRHVLTPRAEKVLSAARALAPVDSEAYRDGLRIEQDTTDRAVVRVVSGDWKGHILEAKYGVLGRALDAAGGR